MPQLKLLSDTLCHPIHVHVHPIAWSYIWCDICHMSALELECMKCDALYAHICLQVLF